MESVEELGVVVTADTDVCDTADTAAEVLVVIVELVTVTDFVAVLILEGKLVFPALPFPSTFNSSFNVNDVINTFLF